MTRRTFAVFAPRQVRAALPEALRPWRRLGDVLFRLAVQATGAHLARAHDAIIAAWQESLRRRVPRYRDAAETAAWGAEGLRVLLAVTRAWTPEEHARARDTVYETARAVRSEEHTSELQSR